MPLNATEPIAVAGAPGLPPGITVPLYETARIPGLPGAIPIVEIPVEMSGLEGVPILHPGVPRITDHIATVLQDTGAQEVAPPAIEALEAVPQGTEVPAAELRVTAVQEVALPVPGVQDLAEVLEAVREALVLAEAQEEAHEVPVCAVPEVPHDLQVEDPQEEAVEAAEEDDNHPIILI